MSIPDVRVEVAFGSQPGDAVQAWTDVTSYVDLAAGISITRGRGNEYGQVQPSTCSLMLDNSDGRFTAGLSSSPYYPNVKIGKQIRVFDPNLGNVLQGDDSTFEASVGSWTGSHATLATSATRAWQGSQSLRITATGTAPAALLSIAGSTLSAGVTYCLSGYVWVPAGTPSVSVQCVLNVATGASGSTVGTGAWERISTTFTVSDSTATTVVSFESAAAVSGQEAWVDAVQLEEASSPSAFTTFGATGPRFTGFVDEWPTSFAPTGKYATAAVTATDRFKRLGQIGNFSNIVAEEVLYDNPIAYYQLGEDATSTTAGDSSGRGLAIMSVTQLGSGGSLTFAANTGPGTDGLSCPAFTPASSSNGKYLLASTAIPVGAAFSIRAAFLTTSATTQTVVRATAASGSYTEIRVTSTGKLQVAVGDAAGSEVTGTSSASVNDGLTHDAVAVVVVGSGTRLYLDGVDVTGLVLAAVESSIVTLYVGGSAAGSLFTGAISHVAVFDSAVSGSRILEQRTATTTGFAGEASDQRIARYARWAGVSTSDQVLEAGDTTSVAFTDSTGLAPLIAMQDVADTEGGLLFIAGDGRLTFHARSHRYNAASALTLTEIGAGDTFVVNDQLLTNDVTANRDGGITFRAIDQGSIDDYGPYRQTTTLLTTSDNEVTSAAQWQANTRSQPWPRLSSLTIDLLTDTSIRAGALALELGDRVTLPTLPAQAPDADTDVFIEGWTETVSTSQWSLVCNTSPAAWSGVWALDSATYSVLGTSTRLAY